MPRPDAVGVVEARDVVLRRMHKPMSMVVDADKHKAENAAILDTLIAAIVAQVRKEVEGMRKTRPYDSWDEEWVWGFNDGLDAVLALPSLAGGTDGQ